MRIIRALAVLPVVLLSALLSAQPSAQTPFKVGVVGLAHGHVAGFFNGVLKRSDVQIVGIAEPDRQLFDRYASRYHLDSGLYYPSLRDMIGRVHPPAVVVYTNTFDNRAVVEECAKNRIHVMMEKPLAVSYHDAMVMADAARTSNIHVLVNYETTWYPSNKEAYDLVQDGGLGELRKVVVHDGHEGPKEIQVPSEFFAWLTNPKLDGAGALYDFGCYGADLMTWLMKGEAPDSVTAVTKQIKPDIYPHVDDEADVIMSYPKAVAILQASWNWPFSIKDMEVYGRTGFAKTILRDRLDVRKQGENESHVVIAKPLEAPYDDSLRYFAAVVNGSVRDDGSLGGLQTNVIVSEILDAARRSAQSGKTVNLPLAP